MRNSALLRVATVVLSLLATTGAVSTAFAAPAQPQANTGVYDGPDFVVPLNDLN